MSCKTLIPYKPSQACASGIKGAVKTVYVDSESYKKIGGINATTEEGEPVIIDNSIPGIYHSIRKLKAPVLVPNISVPGNKDMAKEHQLQAKEIATANIPEDTKKLIAAEFIRLCRLHPNWKPSKAARKAGEKYNVKFVFE